MGTLTARPPTVPVPPEDELGPAMQALTLPQRAFVCATAENPGLTHYTENAMRAGYGGTSESAKVAACRMMRMPKILTAIREEADRRLKSGALLGASMLMKLAEHPDARISFKASVELLNRAGLVVETKHTVTVEDHRDRVQLQDEVRELLNRASQQRLVLPAPLEGEFVEVARDPNDISDLLAPV